MPGPSPWTETSASIEVYCFAFFQGSMRYRSSRDQLSASQLQLLSQLSVIDRTSLCFSDGMECKLSITQSDGSVVSYDSVDGDGDCGNSAMPPKVVAFATFSPFAQTLGCGYAKNLSDSSSAAVALAPDPRCFNGLFSSGGGTINLGLTVGGAGESHHLELDACATPSRAGHVTMQIFAAPGSTTALASGTAVADPGPDGTCLALAYTFPQPGTYALTVIADPTFTPGDFYVRYY